MKKLTLMLSLMLLLVMSVAYSAVTVVTPSDGGTVAGNYSINATCGLSVCRNCTWELGASNTANTSFNLILYNASPSDTNANLTSWGSTGAEDSSLYTGTITCYNASTSSTGTRAFVLDNTVPTAPTSLTTTKQTSSGFDLTATVTGTRTTGGSLSWIDTNPLTSYTDPTCTHAGSTITCTIEKASDYTYKYTITATDGRNTSISEEASVVVETRSGGNYIPPTTTTTGGGTITGKSRLQTLINSFVSWLKNLLKR